MPKIQIEHPSKMNASEVGSKIKNFFEMDEDIRRFDSKLQCQFDEKTLQGKASGSQFKADISVKPQGEGCLIQVVVDLPLILTPLKSKVQEMITKKLSKYLA